MNCDGQCNPKGKEPCTKECKEIKVDTIRAESCAALDKKLTESLNNGWEIIGDIRTVHLPRCTTPIVHYVTLRKEVTYNAAGKM